MLKKLTSFYIFISKKIIKYISKCDNKQNEILINQATESKYLSNRLLKFPDPIIK